MNMPIMFADKFNLSLEQNRFLAKKNIVEVIHSMSRLENVNTTFPQTKTIIDGMSVSGISTHDMQVLLNLKAVKSKKCVAIYFIIGQSI